MHALAVEEATFEAHEHRLLTEHSGRYVCIKGEEIVGVLDEPTDALIAGYRRFGYVDLFTARIQPDREKWFLNTPFARHVGAAATSR